MSDNVIGRYPVGEYTPPGHRTRWRIAADISRCQLEVWSTQFEIDCELDMRGLCGGQAGRARAQESAAFKLLRDRLDQAKSELRLFERELEANNAERVKLYHYFPRRGTDTTTDSSAAQTTSAVSDSTNTGVSDDISE
ncbi:hypothetical protein V5O48_009475 [Marasmius crinis-equi]|uniref:Uncharacterized protein n=1 Tax=Marasmius crinis-equi TaxID=585013 RepID=A0ABR3FBQ8_9AGAR